MAKPSIKTPAPKNKPVKWVRWAFATAAAAGTLGYLALQGNDAPEEESEIDLSGSEALVEDDEIKFYAVTKDISLSHANYLGGGASPFTIAAGSCVEAWMSDQEKNNDLGDKYIFVRVSNNEQNDPNNEQPNSFFGMAPINALRIATREDLEESPINFAVNCKAAVTGQIPPAP